MTLTKPEIIAKELFGRNYFEVKAIMEIIADEQMQQVVRMWLGMNERQKEALLNLMQGKQDELVLHDILELSDEQLGKLNEILSNPGGYGYLMAD